MTLNRIFKTSPNDYAYEEPLDDTGKIIVFDKLDATKHTTVLLDGVRTTQDIISAIFLENGKLIITTEYYFFIVDTETQRVDRQDIPNTAGTMISHKNTVYYIQSNVELAGQNASLYTEEIYENEYWLKSMQVE